MERLLYFNDRSKVLTARFLTLIILQAAPSQTNFSLNVLQSTVPPMREPSPEPVLSAADFPALPVASTDSSATNRQHQAHQQPHNSPAITNDDKEKAKLDKKAARKAAAAEKAAERERKAKEKEAERERAAREKAKEKAEEKARAAKEKAEEKERFAKQKAEKDKLLKEKAEREGKEKAEKEKIMAQRKAEADNKGRNKGEGQAGAKSTPGRATKGQGRATPAAEAAIVTPLPILSKMPKKNKPVTKPLKVPVAKEDDTVHDSQSSHTSAVSASETPQLPNARMPNVSEVSAAETEGLSSRSASEGPDSNRTKIKSVGELLAEIDMEKGPYYLEDHPFFDLARISAASKEPIDYNTMSCALSAFQPGGTSFSENASARLTTQSVTSFQQLLETLTETMSDLVQLLPQTTWGSIFDVLNQGLKDMKREHAFRGATFDGLVQDDLSDDLDNEDYDLGPPTPTMDKRARWMEVQLAKLEDLHRGVNAAAVRAVLASNDRGWDAHGLLPHINNTLSRFENLGLVDEDGHKRSMTLDELGKKLVVAKEAVTFAEAELKEAMRATMAMRL